MAIEHW